MELKPGEAAVHRRTFRQQDFDRFAALSGDDNPIHVDQEFAARTRFGRTVAHGMMLYSTLCGYLRQELGREYEQAEQELMFVAPTYAGEEVTYRLEVMNVSAGCENVDLNTILTRPDGSVGLQGRAMMRRRGTAPVEAAGATVADGSENVQHKGLAVRKAAESTRVFTAVDLAEYVDLTGDRLPAGSGVPGGLLGGLFSYLLGTQLPGRGTNWLKQRLTFPATAPVERAIEAKVEIVRLRPEKDLVNLTTVCTLDDGRVVCQGEALVLVKDLEQG